MAKTTLEKRLMKRFTRWQSPDKLEKTFWKSSDELHSSRGWFAAMHANRPADKLRDEILPILLYAKFISGQSEGIGYGLRIRCNPDNIQTENRSNYDAEYKWIDFQPQFRSSRKNGFLEVTRCVLSVQSEREENKLLSIGGFPELSARDNGVSDAYQNTILCRAKIKSDKNYPENTTLILSLDDQYEATNTANWLSQDSEFMSKLRNITQENFSAVFLCGMMAGRVYLRHSARPQRA